MKAWPINFDLQAAKVLLVDTIYQLYNMNGNYQISDRERGIKMTESNEKSNGQKLMDKLGYNSKNSWEKIGDKEKIFSFCDKYKAFLDKAKTEREAVQEAISQAEKLGYQNLETLISGQKSLSAGD